jgi:phosphotransferase system  glucose/maltose/N-acetylglucosamine-specific IIC component
MVLIAAAAIIALGGAAWAVWRRYIKKNRDNLFV